MLHMPSFLASAGGSLWPARREKRKRKGAATRMKVPAASIYFPPEDRAAILSQIDEILQTGQLTLGKYGRQCEEEFAAKIGVKHAIAVSSGTSAIEIPLRVFGVEG